MLILITGSFHDKQKQIMHIVLGIPKHQTYNGKYDIIDTKKIKPISDGTM